MAIFGALDVVRKQLQSQKFDIAFAYLEKILENGAVENRRLSSLNVDAFEKIELTSSNFALEQVYYSRDRDKCFFESHEKYIDVQFILEGEEMIEVININELSVSSSYDTEMDLAKYVDTLNASQIKLKKGDVAIFFPEDAHMPCLQWGEGIKVYKTVVKVPV